MAQNYLNIYQRLARGESIIEHSFGRSAELDEARITEQYYIATKSSPVDDRARVLKYGGMFSVFDHLGDIQASGLGEQGIFFKGTRHLSELILCLWNAPPLLLSSAIKADNFLFTADLTNLDVSHRNKLLYLGALCSFSGPGSCGMMPAMKSSHSSTTGSRL